MGTIQPPLPLLKCPKCGNADTATACRFCGISKIKPYQPAPNSPRGLLADPLFECAEGAVKVSFRAELNHRPLRVVAVIAPPDPEVGLLDPYPLECIATDAKGVRIPLSYPEARYLASTVYGLLF